jgi:hypothetical protein
LVVKCATSPPFPDPPPPPLDINHDITTNEQTHAFILTLIPQPHHYELLWKKLNHPANFVYKIPLLTSSTVLIDADDKRV